MSDNAEFIAYCIEEYKTAKGITGKELIALFKKHNIIDYIVSCYGALHTMGGLAIAEDIDSLIEEGRRPNKGIIEPILDLSFLWRKNG
jgi:hypothetical protein